MNIRTGWPIPMQKEIDAICEQYAGNALTREGEVFEANGPEAVLPDLRHGRAVAALDLRRRLQFDIDNEPVTGLFSADGFEASKAQQVLVIQRFIPPNPVWRNLSATNIWSQTA